MYIASETRRCGAASYVLYTVLSKYIVPNNMMRRCPTWKLGDIGVQEASGGVQDIPDEYPQLRWIAGDTFSTDHLTFLLRGRVVRAEGIISCSLEEFLIYLVIK